ncbi:hypothetical protein [Spiroplasma endosymbiont of Seladonia tumulorum]|uniref:hypothetical protein n=1 Tax=Spiroplasma endosymbiont of Seladonia tumulorum TaxID=3066321 RepID=UPI0030CB9D6C
MNIGETYNINESLLLFNGNFAANLKIDLEVILKNGIPITWFFDRDSTFLKSVYRWNFNTNIPSLTVDSKTGEIKIEDE